jgi:hypothetical protein
VITFTPTSPVAQLEHLLVHGKVTLNPSPTGLRVIAAFDPKPWARPMREATVLGDDVAQAIASLHSSVFDPVVIR